MKTHKLNTLILRTFKYSPQYSILQCLNSYFCYMTPLVSFFYFFDLKKVFSHWVRTLKQRRSEEQCTLLLLSLLLLLLLSLLKGRAIREQLISKTQSYNLCSQGYDPFTLLYGSIRVMKLWVFR